MTEKHILYILANEPTGGVGTFVLDFTSKMSSETIVDYLIYTSQRNTPFQNKIQTVNNHIFYLPELSVKDYFGLKKKTEQFFYQHKGEYDVVHLTYPGIIRLCFPAAKKYGIKHRIVHSLNTRLSDNPLKSIRNKMLCFGWKNLANHYLACSEDAAEYLYGKEMVQNNQVVMIHNAIDCNQYQYRSETREKVRKQLSAENKRIFLCVGRLENQKNIGFAIDVFHEIRKLDPNTQLLIIGSGVLKKDYQAKVTTNQDDGFVTFIEYTTELNEYMNASDVLLFPSLYEGLPITIIDAQNCGLPCLLADTITKEVCLTLLVQYMSLRQSHTEWAKRALSLVALDRRDYSKEITEKGYNILDEVKKLEEFYQSIIEKGSKEESLK